MNWFHIMLSELNICESRCFQNVPRVPCWVHRPPLHLCMTVTPHWVAYNGPKCATYPPATYSYPPIHPSPSSPHPTLNLCLCSYTQCFDKHMFFVVEILGKQYLWKGQGNRHFCCPIYLFLSHVGIRVILMIMQFPIWASFDFDDNGVSKPGGLSSKVSINPFGAELNLEAASSENAAAYFANFK